MEMDAIVFGIGPYYQEIVDLMPYPADWYEGVTEGERVCGRVAYANTTGESHLLAKCLGISIDSMNWTVSRHRISIRPAREEGDERMIEQIRDLKILMKCGWKLFFDPQA